MARRFLRLRPCTPRLKGVISYTLSVLRCFSREDSMPPRKDAKLEERILQAAQRLWKTRGEKSLTLRAVAREAGTTTPTVYKRFPSKEALRTALARRFRDQLNLDLLRAKSIEEIYRSYLRWAEEHPHEYHLLFRAWADIFHPDMPRPGRMWFMTQLARRFGGRPEEYSRAFFAMFLLAHGAAAMVTTSTDEVAREEIRRNYLQSADALLQNIDILRN
jgi:AcrR family transcriptional regulator